MISVEEAQTAVLTRTPLLPAEKVSLLDAAGRVLREPAVADRDLPPFNRAAMDGFAIRSADAGSPKAQFRVVGEVRAGAWPNQPVGPGEAIRIMTGAPVPEGADAVVQVERTEPVDHVSAEMIELEIAMSPAQNIVARGSEATAGTTLLDEGIRIGPAHLAVMASVGLAMPRVSRQPRVAVIVTGDEVVDPAAQPTKAQIRNANGPALQAAIREAGALATDLGVVSDDAAATRAAIKRALDEGHDALVLSGGVSAGAFDFVEGALSELDVSLHVTAVRVKPGAPFVFGTRGSTLIFGLPGNPVSVQVTFELFVRPALLKMQGATAISRPILEGTLVASLTNRSGRKNYVPVRAIRDADGLAVRPLRTQGSGDVVAHASANALAILEPERTNAEAGERVPLYPFSSFLEV